MATDYLTTDTELKSVADAIRAKGGTSAVLVYPADYISAIQAIQTGTDVSDTTAIAGNVLTGKYFYTSAGVRTQGTMADKGAVSGTISTKAGTYTIPAGYHNGSGSVAISSTEQAKIISGNIKKGITLLGVSGSSTVVDVSDETATPSYVLSTVNFYNQSGNKVAGTMTNNAAVSGTISTKAEQYTVPQGYHNGSGKVQISSTEQAKIIATNIKSGITILGQAGSSTVKDVSDTTAGAGDVYTGKKFYAANGTYTTGTLTVVSVVQDATTKILTIS